MIFQGIPFTVLAAAVGFSAQAESERIMREESGMYNLSQVKDVRPQVKLGRQRFCFVVADAWGNRVELKSGSTGVGSGERATLRPRPSRQLPLRHRENSASSAATRSCAARARTISREAR